MLGINYKVIQGIIESKAILDDQRDGMFIANSVLTRLSRELQLADNEEGGRRLIASCDNLPAPSSSGPAAAQTPTGPQPILIGDEKSVGTGARGDTLTFLAREGGQYVPDGGSHSGVVQITYRAEPDPEQKGNNATLLLIRDEMPYRKPSDLACKNAIRFPITNNLVSLQFWYFDKKNNEWVDSWTDQRSFRTPSMIQYQVKLRSPGGQIQSYTSTVALASGTKVQ